MSMAVILYCDYFMNIGILIQARMGSTRLPGKVLETIGSEPLIVRVLNELLFVSNASSIQVVTSESSKDDALCEVVKNSGFKYFRGDELDVLGRYLSVASKLSVDAVVRVNGDCPFIDPMLVENVINYYISHANNVDYVSTVLDETFPLGMHVEIFSFEALKKCSDHAVGLEREHVTPFIYNNPSIFRVKNFGSEVDLSEYRLTVDYPEDLVFSRKLSMMLDAKAEVNTPRNQLDKIVSCLRDNPELVSINSKFKKSQTIRYS